MKIPRIKIEFQSLVHQTEKAYLFVINGKEVWMPKSICSEPVTSGALLNGTYGKGFVTVAPFKYQELTGVVPQAIDSLVIDDVKSNLELNQIPDYDIVEPKGISLNGQQVEKIIKIKRLRVFFVYGQMRTGKTVIATTIAESRYCSGIISKVVVIAPLRTKKVWESHLSIPYKFIPTEHFSNQHTREKIEDCCDSDTMVILDESHQIKNRNTIRVDRIIDFAALAGHKCILTGTPIGKHAGDLFYQFSFLDPKILNYNTYSDFESSHLLYGGRDGKKVVAYCNIEEISNRIAPYTVTMSRAAMGIDREKIYDVQTYEITNRDKYSQLKEKYEKHYEQNNAMSILGYMVKLQQCANGYEIDDNDEVCGYSNNGRIECLKSLLIKFSDKQIVVYFKYNEDVKDISKELNIPVLSGKTRQKDFDDTVQKFNALEINVIALQQQLSIGFSLRAADVMIYYSRKFGSISSAQSEDRACESAEKPLLIVDICAKNTIDEAIKSTINKQFDIINLFKSEIKNENKHTR
jgi:hypothetical protein